MELEEFNIRYKPRPAIKFKVLANIITEMTQPTMITDDRPVWKLFIDESSNSKRCIAGVVLQGLNRQDIMEYTLKLGFKASNNEAKYEALLIDLQLA